MRRGVPVNINMGFGIRSRPTTPLIPLPRLKALGVRRVSAAAHAAGRSHLGHEDGARS